MSRRLQLPGYVPPVNVIIVGILEDEEGTYPLARCLLRGQMIGEIKSFGLRESQQGALGSGLSPIPAAAPCPPGWAPVLQMCSLPVPLWLLLMAYVLTPSYCHSLFWANNPTCIAGCNLILIICYLAQRKKGTNCILDNI